jgi:hypothetical protein
MLKRIAIHALNTYSLVSARIYLATVMRRCSSYEAIIFMDITRDHNACRLADNKFHPWR